MSNVKIESSWKSALVHEFSSDYWKSLTDYIRDQYKSKNVYPPPKKVFRAFDLCPLDKVKVVIVGQDPYHGLHQANGLCFAVEEGIRLPPSLKNIFKEIKDDLGVEPLMSGDLSRWAKQGVFMLNSVLTVAAGSPASHAGLGWEKFTDAVIKALNDKRKNVVYLLWGKYAQNKGLVIDREKNLVLTSAHPSPYSATMFFGNNHFSKCNEYLRSKGIKEIDWK